MSQPSASCGQNDDMPKGDMTKSSSVVASLLRKGTILGVIAGGVFLLASEIFNRSHSKDFFDRSLYERAELDDILLNINGVRDTNSYRGKFVEISNVEFDGSVYHFNKSPMDPPLFGKDERKMGEFTNYLSLSVGVTRFETRTLLDERGEEYELDGFVNIHFYSDDNTDAYKTVDHILQTYKGPIVLRGIVRGSRYTSFIGHSLDLQVGGKMKTFNLSNSLHMSGKSYRAPRKS